MSKVILQNCSITNVYEFLINSIEIIQILYEIVHIIFDKDYLLQSKLSYKY
jgi:hypothetical protein